MKIPISLEPFHANIEQWKTFLSQSVDPFPGDEWMKSYQKPPLAYFERPKFYLKRHSSQMYRTTTNSFFQPETKNCK